MEEESRGSNEERREEKSEEKGGVHEGRKENGGRGVRG